MFGAILAGPGAAMTTLNNQNIGGSGPTTGPYLLCDGTDILLTDNTPMLLA